MLTIQSNPYTEPIQKFYNELKETKWKFPFIPQVIHSLVTILILSILFILYLSIGIISQISSTFWNLIVQTGQKINIEEPIESSAYAIAIGIYFLLFLPFFLIQFPFYLLGWFISKIGFKYFVFIVFLILAIILLLYLSPTLSNKLNNILNLKDSVSTQTVSVDSTNQKENLKDVNSIKKNKRRDR